MAEEASTPQNVVVPPPAETTPAQPEAPQTEVKEAVVVNGGDIAQTEPIKEVATEPVAPASPVPEGMIAFPVAFSGFYAPADSIFFAFSKNS